MDGTVLIGLLKIRCFDISFDRAQVHVLERIHDERHLDIAVQAVGRHALSQMNAFQWAQFGAVEAVGVEMTSRQRDVPDCAFLQLQVAQQRVELEENRGPETGFQLRLTLRAMGNGTPPG